MKHFTDQLRHRRTWKRGRKHTPLVLLALLVFVICFMAIAHTTTVHAQNQPPQNATTPQTEPGHYCNTILLVFAHFGLLAEDLGNGQYQLIQSDYSDSSPIDLAATLAKLPAPDPTRDLTYDPQTRVVCASETNGKQALTQLFPNPTTQSNQYFDWNPIQWAGDRINDAKNLINPAQWVAGAITGFWDSLWRQIVTFLQTEVIDWCNDFGFLWITPAALSYKNAMVLAGATWTMSFLDGYVALLLVIGGYQFLLNRTLGMEDRSSVLGSAMRVIFAALIANTGFFVLLPFLVELCNSMCTGIMVAMMGASAGDVSLPLGAINWVTQPIAWGIFIVIDFLISVFLIAVDAVRLAVLDVTIMLSPLWIMALANGYSRSWGRFGALTFFSALLMQPLQVACISLGAALIANFGRINPRDPSLCQYQNATAHAACVSHLGHASLSSSMNIVVLILGIATLYVAIKIPGMLFSNALRASVGSVNQDIARVARSVMSFVFLQKQLDK